MKAAIAAWFRRLGALLAGAIRTAWTTGLTAPGKGFYALLFSVAGAGILTSMLGWAMDYLMGRQQDQPIAYIAYGLLGVVAMTIFSLGKLLAGKQAIEAELWKFKFRATQDGDDDDDLPPPNPTTTVETPGAKVTVEDLTSAPGDDKLSGG